MPKSTLATSIIKTDRFIRNTSNIQRVTGAGASITITTPYGNYAPVLVFGIFASNITVFMAFPWSEEIIILSNPRGMTLTKTSGSTYTISTSTIGGMDAVVVGGFTSASVS